MFHCAGLWPYLMLYGCPYAKNPGILGNLHGPCWDLPSLAHLSFLNSEGTTQSFSLPCLPLPRLGHSLSLLLSIALLYCKGHRGRGFIFSELLFTSKPTSSVSTPGIFSYLSCLRLLSSVPILPTRPLLGRPPLTIISPLCACVVEYYFN